MKKKRIARWCLAAVVTFVVACVTVNIYFPAAEVQKAADQIVEEVRPEAPPSAPDSPATAPQSFISPKRFWKPVWVSSAVAAVDINVSTPAIRQLKAQLKDRFKALRAYYNQGVIGEDNQGYLKLRNTEDLSLKEKAQAKQLVEAENKDRRSLYQEILRANNLDSKFLEEVERLFANSWRKEASRKGWWVQKDDGSWGK